MVGTLLLIGILPSLCMFVYAIYGLKERPYSWRSYYPFLLCAIFIFAYSYIPIGSPDLTRYIEMATELQSKNLLDAIKHRNDSLYVLDLYLWMIARIGNYRLLGAIPLTITYGIAFYITCDYSFENSNEKVIPSCLVLQASLLPFFSILNNVRCVCAFCVIILAAYEDLIKLRKKIFVLSLYFFPCLFHPMAIIILALRVIVEFKDWLRYFPAILVFCVPKIVDYVYTKVGVIRYSTFRVLISKVYWYFHDDYRSEYSKSVAASGAEKFQKTLFFSIAIAFFFILICKYKDVEKEWRKFYYFIFLLNISVFACMPVNTPQYWRFFSALVVGGTAPVLLIVLTQRKIFRQLFQIFAVIIIMAGVFIQTWKSKYIVNYGEWIFQILISNIYRILFETINILLKNMVG